MNKVYFILLLCLFSSCKMNKTNPAKECKAENADTDLVSQVTGDTVKVRQVLEDTTNYSPEQLLAIKEELGKKLEESEYKNIKINVIGYGVGLRHVEIYLMVNTPERRKEFREKIMDSPAFLFNGVERPVVNEKVGMSHTRGIYIRPEYSIYSTNAEQATFILNNHSGMTIECGEHYYITFEDEKDVWRELPINATFTDMGYAIQDKQEWTMKASLYPDVHPNKPGRYRYFYKVRINRVPVLMMAEFRLTDNEKEWKEAERTPLPEGLLNTEQNGSLQPLE